MSRIRRVSPLCALLLLAAAVERGQADPVQVFLLGGQSNMAGRAPASGLPATPVNLQQPQDDVLLFNGTGGSLPLDTLVSLQPGSGTDFGPEITFGRAMADSDPTATFALLKWAVGGTSLAVDWAPGTGGSYASFQSTVSAGLTALTDAGYEPEIVGMLWMQGERDARDATHTANYASNLTAFIADMRSHYGANMPFLIGETFKNTYGDAISAAQQSVADADELTSFVSTRSFSFQSDNLHLDASGQQDLGNAFASAYLGTDGNGPGPGPGPEPHPQALAQWDIDGDAGHSGTWFTQDGFAGLHAHGNDTSLKDPIVAVSNGYTLTMAGTWKYANDRSPSSNPALAGHELESMLRDFVTAPESAFGSLEFELNALAPDTDYTVRVWSYDASSNYDGRIIDWKDAQGTVIGTITLNSADPNSCHADLAVTSDGDGALAIVADGRGFNFWVNGIELLPEPGALSLLVAGALAVVRRRRRRPRA